MNKCPNQRQNSNDQKCSSFSFSPRLFSWGSPAPHCPPPLGGGLLYSPVHASPPLNTRAPWDPATTSPSATPLWFPPRISLAPHTKWMGCKGTDTGFLLEWFCYTGKISQRFNSNRILPSILHMIVQFWKPKTGHRAWTSSDKQVPS